MWRCWTSSTGTSRAKPFSIGRGRRGRWIRAAERSCSCRATCAVLCAAPPPAVPSTSPPTCPISASTTAEERYPLPPPCAGTFGPCTIRTSRPKRPATRQAPSEERLPPSKQKRANVHSPFSVRLTNDLHRSPYRHSTKSWDATSRHFSSPASTPTSVRAKSSVSPGPRPVITLPSTTAARSVASSAPCRYFSNPG